MAQLTVSKIVDAPVAEVFSTWEDFGNVYKFHPALSSSKLLSSPSKPIGVGAERQCTMADKKNWVRERIEEFIPNRKIRINVYDGTMPLKSMTATVLFDQVSAERTRIRLTADFEPKMGILGRLMAPLMKRQFQAMISRMLDCNAAHVTRGEVVPAAA